MQKILMAFVITAVLVGPIVMHDSSRLAYATPSIQLIPNSGSPGEIISYTVSGVSPNSQYRITFDSTEIASGVTNPTGGALSGTFVVPVSNGGISTVTYDDFIPGDKVGVPFTVTGSVGTASIPSSVTIAGTCGIITTGALQYGTLIPGATSQEQTLTITNTGTVSAALFVSGTDWLDGSATPVNQINAANTKWSTTLGTAYAGKTALTTSPAMMTSTLDIAPTTLPTYWQLQANLNHGTFTGSLTQTVLLSVSC